MDLDLDNQTPTDSLDDQHETTDRKDPDRNLGSVELVRRAVSRYTPSWSRPPAA
jgi:hypothetical protein